MQKNAKKAFDALKKIGAPVIDRDDDDGHFVISGEDNDTKIWADYYDEFGTGYDFGVSPEITKILEENGLYAEWYNAGFLIVYDA